VAVNCHILQEMKLRRDGNGIEKFHEGRRVRSPLELVHAKFHDHYQDDEDP
jgi:hypothetical protein